MANFDMEQATKDAMKEWDKTHGAEDSSDGNSEDCGDPTCMSCNKEMTAEDRKKLLLAEKMFVDVVPNPDNPTGEEVGVVVSLPTTRSMARTMLLAVIRTMSIASGETPESVIELLIYDLKNEGNYEPIEFNK